VLRVLALAIVITTPSAALAQPTTAAILATSVFARDTAPQAAPKPVKILIEPRRQKPGHRMVAADLREMQAFEYRPARDYGARPEGFALVGKKLSFFRTF
jgi:hypothetical protein